MGAHYKIELYKFKHPTTYWEALTEQNFCFIKASPLDISSRLFRVKNYFNGAQLTNYSFPIAIATEAEFKASTSKHIQEGFYTNSLAETAYYLFFTGALFRIFEIVGYRIKADILKNTPKKEHISVHIGFELAFLATTAVICKILSVPYYDYMHAKIAEYCFRGAGYLAKSKYSLMDYAADINLVSLTNKDTLKDFFILKSLFFLKNYLITAFIDNYSIAVDDLDSHANGLQWLFNYDLMHVTILCNNNKRFIAESYNFINFVQETGLSSGALAVDLSLVALKYVGVVKDVNTGRIDSNYRRNLILAAQSGINAVRSAADNTVKAVKRIVGIDDAAIEGNNYRYGSNGANLLAVVGRIPKGSTNNKFKEQDIVVEKKQDNNFLSKNFPALPENAIILEDKYSSSVKHAIFAINVCKDSRAGVFNEILNNKGSRPSFKQLTVKSNCGYSVYELQHPGQDHRLIGPLLKSTTAMPLIRKFVGEERAADIIAKFDAYTKVSEKESWSCIRLEKYVAKHQDITKNARELTIC